MSIVPIDFKITIYPRKHRNRQYLVETSVIPLSEYSDKVTVLDRKKLAAFCQHEKCSPNKKYIVNNFGIGFRIDCKKTTIECPHCDHALFWAYEYDEINDDNKDSPPKKRRRKRKKKYLPKF